MNKFTAVSKPKTLITGSSGFIGSRLLHKMQPDVLGIQVGPADQTAISCDMTNADEVELACQSLASAGTFGAAIHLAGITPWSSAAPDYSLDIKMAQATQRFCKAAKISKLIYLSGWNVYDMALGAPFTEESSLSPQGDYGASKYAVEEYFKNTRKDVEVIVLRLGSIYGPGQLSSGLIPNLTTAALREGTITLHDAQVKRDYLYIEDLLRALVQVSNGLRAKSNGFSTINISSVRSFSVDEVAKCIQRHVEELHRKPVSIKIATEFTKDPIQDNHLAVEKALSLGLLQQPTSLNDGIRKYVEWRVSENLF